MAYLKSAGDCGGLNAGAPRRRVARRTGLWLVAAGRFDRILARQNRRVVDVPLAVAIAMPHCVDPDGALVRTARGLAIGLGDD